MDFSCSKQRHHAVLVPFPAQGHINPMMQVALKLVDEGFFISFVNTDYNHSRIAEANKTSLSNHTMIRSVVVPDGLPSDDTRPEMTKLLDVIENVIVPFLDNLIHQIKEGDNDSSVCLVVDVMASQALEIAQRYHIPRAALWTSLTATYALLCNIPSLVSSQIIPSNGVPKDFKMVKYLPSMPPLCSAHLPWAAGFDDSELFFHFINRCMERVRTIDWVICNSFHHLEDPAISSVVENGGSVCPIGSLIPSSLLNSNSGLRLEITTGFWAEDDECLDWLDRQSRQSVIYVSFGSVSVLSETQFQQLALGLEATERPFLWVVRPNLLQGSEVAFPPGFAERIQRSQRGCLVSWCPQLRVLSHPSIACFLTHCGWNSALESITMGVPMLCWPHFADQFLNQSYIVHVWKIGLSLLKENNASTESGTSIIDMTEIKRAVERAVTGEEGAEMKRRVMKLSESAIAAVKEGGSSDTNFRNFATAMKTVEK